MAPKRTPSKPRASSSPKGRVSGQTNKSGSQPACTGADGTGCAKACKQTRHELNNDPEEGKKTRKKEAPAAIKKEGDSPYPKNTVLWLVHYDPALDDWVCSSCGHPISAHPQGEAPPTRGRTASLGTGTKSRKNALDQAGEKCEVTSVSRVGCDGCHIIPRSDSDGLRKLRVLTENPSIVSLDDRRNMLFLNKHLHSLFDALKLSFEHTGGTTYTVHDWSGDLAKVGCKRRTVELAAHRKVLMWHHEKCMLQNLGAAEKQNSSRSDERGGGHGRGAGGGGGGGGGARGRATGRGGTSSNDKKHKRADASGEELPKAKKKAAEVPSVTMRNIGLHNAYPDSYGATTVSSWKVDPPILAQ